VLASEGFTSVEEVAYVDADEISSIDGFDDDTASEIQARAREFLDRIEAEQDAKRRELGVADELRNIPGVTTAMMVTLGEDGVKTVDDFAGYAVDDLVGWKERKDGETKMFAGVLANHGVSRADAEQMVLSARLQAGWITEDDLATEEEVDAETAEA
jgi:N utilization substance protein A